MIVRVVAIVILFLSANANADSNFKPIITGYDFIAVCSDIDDADKVRLHKCLSYINGILAGNIGTISVQAENDEASRMDIDVDDIHSNNKIHESATNLAASRRFICAGHVADIEEIARVLVPMFYASGADLGKNNAYYIAIKSLTTLYPCGHQDAS